MLTKFLTRLNWAVKAFNSPIYSQIQLGNGVILDLDNQKIIIPGDFALHTEGNLRLSSDKHVIIKSGQTEEPRPGYIHGIWLNSEEDQFGQPLLDQKDIEIENGDSNYKL